MELWTATGWVLLSIVAGAACFLIGTLVVSFSVRKQLARSLKYVLNRLQVVESDLAHLTEETQVLREYLQRKGLLDDEDLLSLRREIIERPRQVEAEKAELLRDAPPDSSGQMVVKNTPDTLH